MVNINYTQILAIHPVFSRIDPTGYSSCFSSRTKRLYRRQKGRKGVTAMDGKTVRNSHHGGRKSTAIHEISALAVDNTLCPGQIATVEKSSRMTVIPELLSLVDIEGDIVSIDAMGCQKRIAKKIRAAGADCIPAVKENQSLTEESINDTIRFVKPAGEDMDMDCGHGSIETRKCRTCTDFTCFENAGQWKDIHSIVEDRGRKNNKKYRKKNDRNA
ncbi:MAG: ISAs1 family transposase, partial [Tannerella sp.]|nr:ISAs1 family transposase [Tannerella sp.]